ncbi:MAG TPA: single-stranded DNA-binding protein [Burkholderiaceae bacterium]
MSRGYQRVIVTGHLGAVPEVKAPQSGGLIAEFRIAVTDRWKTRAGEWDEHTEWLAIKAFGRTAEIVQQYLGKGSLVQVEGKIRTEKWQASDGSDRYRQWIYCDPAGLLLLSSREHTRTAPEHQGGRQAAPAPKAALRAVHEQEFSDDDIPF